MAGKGMIAAKKFAEAIGVNSDDLVKAIKVAGNNARVAQNSNNLKKFRGIANAVTNKGNFSQNADTIINDISSAYNKIGKEKLTKGERRLLDSIKLEEGNQEKSLLKIGSENLKTTNANKTTPNINTGKTVVNNQSQRIRGSKIDPNQRSTWDRPAEGPLDVPTNDANQAKARMQRGEQAQKTAEGTAQKEAEQTGAGSTNNGSGENIPKPGNPTGNPETPPKGPDAGDVQQAMDEEIANAKNNAWYNDEAARKHLAKSKDTDISRENVAFENKYKDISEEYQKGLGEFYEERNLQGKVKDAAKLREYQEAWGGRLQEAVDEHDKAIGAIKDRKVGVMDWVQGHDYDKAAVGIGALGFAGSVAFGGAKSNADLYSNPF